MMSWRSVIQGERASMAQGIALRVLECYKDRDRILELAEGLKKQTRLPRQPQWLGYNLPFGDAGVALTAGYAHRLHPANGWDRLAHDYLKRATESTGELLFPSLMGGLSGLAFTVDYLSLEGTRYQKAKASLDDLLARMLKPMIEALPSKEGMAVSVYDQISGVSGTSRYLLNARDHAELKGLLARMLDWLIARSTMPEVSGFFTSPDDISSYELEYSPHLAPGYTNCGLAHGVPGPLALMSLAALEGYKRPGLHDAIRKLADWLAAQRYEDEWGVNWPTHKLAEEASPSYPTRTAWCYGLPGVTRALFLAGRALADEALQDLAADALLAVEKRPVAARGIDSPTFCHGVAGLLQIVLRFANDTQDSAFTRFAVSLTDQLMAAFDEDAPLGFRDIETGHHAVDSPGLLTGALSPALVLLAASSDCPPEWDQVFLL